MKKIAIFSRKIKESQIQTFVNIFEKLDNLNCNLLIYRDLFENISNKISLKSHFNLFSSYKDIDGCSFILSVGGDGTLLDTISFVRDSGIPVLGLNIGRLGFLANTTYDNFEYAIKEILINNYSIDKRTLIRIDTNKPLFGDINYALNEIAVLKSDVSSMIKIDVHVNDLFLNTYWADGIIVATPTGSTAYSLSCGGPIIVPESNSFIITPVASHNLTVRPVVISDSSVIKINIDADNTPFLINLDSRKIKTSKKTEIIITREDFTYNLIKLKTDNFFSTIRNKLMWGIDKRN